MKKSILEIYGLAVCFFAVVMITVNLGAALYSIIGLVSPELTLSGHAYERHLTNESFIAGGVHCENESAALEVLSDDEITAKREKSYEIALKSHARNELQGLVRELIYIVISFIVLFIHWIVARGARE